MAKEDKGSHIDSVARVKELQSTAARGIHPESRLPIEVVKFVKAQLKINLKNLLITFSSVGVLICILPGIPKTRNSCAMQ
jgi:hypothetical protein